jgi:hypothetical protein
MLQLEREYSYTRCILAMGGVKMAELVIFRLHLKRERRQINELIFV